ncbi:MAG: RHS repeat-associated core domain-containing protein, partial [Paenibacillaceae bacterium]|nr:RHS repeat-associated core domain-containing protein [Paenibacillaceae bacterium]
RIMTNSQGNALYSYDKKGNRLALQSSFLSDGTDEMAYDYDEWNRLVKVSRNGIAMETNQYNGDGLLVEQTKNGTTTRYYYDGTTLIAEGTVGAGGNVDLKARYIRAGSRLVSRESANGQKGYYLLNGHGDVVELRSSNNTILAQYSYDIWGNPMLVNEQGMTNPFRYSGELWDNETSLQYLRARWYDPSNGRFISKDTYEGQIDNPLSLNLYTYVGNNPLIRWDPDGHKWELIKNGWEGTKVFVRGMGEDFVDAAQLAWYVGSEYAMANPLGAGIEGAILKSGELVWDGYQWARVAVSGAQEVKQVITYSFNSPSVRHYAAKVTQKTLAKESNTVIEPWVDVSADVTAINSGQVTRVGEQFTVNGRTYGFHDNTLFPISGEGFHPLDRGAFKALGVYNNFGNSEKAKQILDNMGMGEEARNAALKVWEAIQ